MVFLVADLDRSWEKDQLRCAPVSWFPRGHSLSTENLRNITEQVHTLCHREGIHIPCQSFDGQWHGIVTRNKNGQPLTVFQLQKDTWKETEQMKKADIVSLLRTMNKVVHNSSQIGPSGRIIELSNGNIRLPRFPVHLNSKRIVLDEVATAESITQATLADVIPESVKSANNLDDRVLALTSVEDQIEIEAFAVNVFDDEWENELDKCKDDLESVDIESHVEQESDLNQQLTSENKEIQCESNDNSSERKISQGMPSSVVQLSINDMNCLLAMFKTTKDCNKKGKWDNTSPEDLLLQFSSIDKLRLFLDVELCSVVRYLKKTKECKIKESSTKGKKLEELAALLNINFDKEMSGLVKRKKKPQQVKSLSELATQTIQKLPKLTLNVIHAELIWENRYDNWISKIRTVTVNGMKHDWFYKPDFSEIRNQYDVRCIDATHLLTRTRTKVCKGGIEGLTNESWLKVARSGKTLLTPAMIQEIIDPMSMSMAITHFSPEVENMMRSNGDTDSANLCHDIRSWWQADDTLELNLKKDKLCARA
ncbi:unnamed protein product [Mytilus edulis]|uniref:Uncharacterized protein n=1 Tax=Mytilus edulis TaxID=6550 RepID=A0A8S3VJ40_MYTED|nr:unnamed protein product [Mytilus edulis]